MAEAPESPPSASGSGTISPPEVKTLSDAQRAKVERNRQKALLLRQSRQQARPYPSQPKKTKSTQPVDTGAGFFLDPAEEEAALQSQNVVHPPGALLMLNEEQLICEECGKEFLEGSLYETFGLSVCDECRDSEEKHRLITRTIAKEKYLLKDVDFDKREPPLRFIEKKNPRNERWGRMKLYLESQVAARSQEVWGGDQQLEEERERRLEAKDKVKQKRYDKKVKELRMAVRSSLWRKDLGSHEHEYGEETYDEDEDTYSKTCTTCGHVHSYEKM